MRRRPQNQHHRGLRQLTLGADGLVHPRKDFYGRTSINILYIFCTDAVPFAFRKDAKIQWN